MFKDIGTVTGTLQTNCLAVPISSTLVRRTIREGGDARPFLHLDVWNYIDKKGLYKKGPDE